jgi:hypothetical protein
MTALGEIDEGLAQGRQRFGLALQFLRPRQRDPLYIGAAAARVGPQAEQGPDLLDRKTEIAGIGDEPQAMEVTLAIVAITRSRRGGAGMRPIFS